MKGPMTAPRRPDTISCATSRWAGVICSAGIGGIRSTVVLTSVSLSQAGLTEVAEETDSHGGTEKRRIKTIFSVTPLLRVNPFSPPPPFLLREDLSEEIDRARIPGLAEPEDRLPPHLDVAMRTGQLDQSRDTLVLRQPAEGGHGLLLHLCIRILIERDIDGRKRLLGGALRQPDQGLTAGP